MALVIVSAKNINEANEKSINKKDKKSYIIEDKGLQDFFLSIKIALVTMIYTIN